MYKTKLKKYLCNQNKRISISCEATAILLELSLDDYDVSLHKNTEMNCHLFFEKLLRDNEM